MLGLIFRGIFLIGILTWYSTSVWKMIDGYFRDQFRSYLEEEYRKNPQMKSAVTPSPPDNTDSPVITARPETTAEPARRTAELEESAAPAVAVTENKTVALIGTDEASRLTDGTSENQTARESTTDKNAFHKTVAESSLESGKSSENEGDSERSIDRDDLGQERRGNYDRHRSNAARPATVAKSARRYARSGDFSRRGQLASGRHVKTVTLYRKDAKSRVSNDDFWEFEEDAAEKPPLEGVLVSELPFKPRADIGDLDRVTADEYCPLTLDDEASCDETFEWP